MGMRYWDPLADTYRIKRRYIWGALGFLMGGIGMLLVVAMA